MRALRRRLCPASTTRSSSPAFTDAEAIADHYLKLGAPMVALKMGARWLR
jgi:hypothetical protein